MQLLTTHNPKTAKGEGHGYVTHAMHLAPSDLSGYQACPMATAGCRAACLNTAGRGGIKPGHGVLSADEVAAGHTNHIQAARIRRTQWFFEDRKAFMAQLVGEIQREVRKARKHGVEPVFRLNATSDIGWEKIRCERDGVSYRNIMQAFPDVTFYDYTKIPLRKVPDNYHLTFSLAEDNDQQAALALANGMTVAVVFRKQLPSEFWIGQVAADVINGDENDLRFEDAAGVIVGLKAKGNAKKDTSGFVREAA